MIVRVLISASSPAVCKVKDFEGKKRKPQVRALGQHHGERGRATETRADTAILRIWDLGSANLTTILILHRRFFAASN